MTSSYDLEDEQEITKEFEVTEVGSKKAIQNYLDTLPPPPAEDTIPG